MRAFVDRVFFNHPATVDETYGEHFTFAAHFGIALIGAGCAAIVHALVPCLFERTASTTVKRLHAVVANRTAVPARVIVDDPRAYI